MARSMTITALCGDSARRASTTCRPMKPHPPRTATCMELRRVHRLTPGHLYSSVHMNTHNADAQTILHAASARMLRVSYGVM
jgi:hypothetical protein